MIRRHHKELYVLTKKSQSPFGAIQHDPDADKFEYPSYIRKLFQSPFGAIQLNNTFVGTV